MPGVAASLLSDCYPLPTVFVSLCITGCLDSSQTLDGTSLRTASCNANPSFLKDVSGVRTAPAEIKAVNSSVLLLDNGEIVDECNHFFASAYGEVK